MQLHWQIEGALPARAHPPMGSNSCFCIHFHQKVSMLEVGAPQWLSAPQQKILDQPLTYHLYMISQCQVISHLHVMTPYLTCHVDQIDDIHFTV